jgi:uncharacterized damage-inducible protein DinB
MTRSLLDCFRRWFDYERDSHDKALKSLESVPAEQRSSPPFERAVSIMAHLAVARQLWLHRFGAGGEAPRDPSEFFPKGLTLAQLAGKIGAAQDAWSRYLSRLNEAELGRAFEYQSLDGKRYRNTVEEVLTQLFGHSWYHRGQIAMLVRQAGGEPAATDYVFWTREAL